MPERSIPPPYRDEFHGQRWEDWFRQFAAGGILFNIIEFGNVGTLLLHTQCLPFSETTGISSEIRISPNGRLPFFLADGSPSCIDVNTATELPTIPFLLSDGSTSDIEIVECSC
jgi:hypothetical protein